MQRIRELETIFIRETGFSDLPETVFKRMFTSYYPYPPRIRISTAKIASYERETLEFIWFHEAYHHHQIHFKGQSFDEPEREYLDPYDEKYLWITSEREANLFAYDICIKYEFPIPTWIAPDYFRR